VNPLPPVQLTFFTELEEGPLVALFSEPDVVARLVELNARVSMGIMDLSEERAAVVRRLNEAGIPLVAWQLLPKEKGYWYHLGNANDAVAHYLKFHEWSIEEGLAWDAVGIDIEPDLNEIQQLLKSRLGVLSRFARRLWNKQAFAESCAEYASLVARMRADGYAVHSYEFFFMTDERRVGSSLLARLFGIADVPADKRVAMLYSSFFRPMGVGLLGVYAEKVDSVAVGITGGGVELEGLEHKTPMSWEELSRDLGIANRCHSEVHIFSLEGCVEQGYLARLSTFDWSRETHCPLHWKALLTVTRFVALGLLWALANLKFVIVAAAVIALLMLVVFSG